jgi:hypothetical protein
MNKNKDQKNEYKIVVEIPAVPEKANVVVNMDHLAFADRSLRSFYEE